MFWYVLVTNPWGSDLYPISIFLQRVPNDAKNEAKTRPENSFGTPPSFSSSLPPARQQVSSRSLEAVWQQLSSSLHAARGDIPQPFSSSPASAQQQPSCRPASTVIRWIDATTLERHPPAGRHVNTWLDLLEGHMNEPGMTKKQVHQCKHKLNEAIFTSKASFSILRNCSTASKRMLGRLSREVPPN